MSFASCPSAVIGAPIDTVWALLTSPVEWENVFDIRMVDIDPPGRAVAGQWIRGETGPRFLHLKITLQIIEIDLERHRLALDVKLPFGMTVLEDLHCTPLSSDACRVDYHCDFDFHDGWQGKLVRLLTRRQRILGPIDSLTRLKRAAEKSKHHLDPGTQRNPPGAEHE